MCGPRRYHFWLPKPLHLTAYAGVERGKGKGGKKWCDHYHQTEFFRSASRLRCHSLRHPLARNRRWSITDKPRALKESLQFVVCCFIQAKQKGVLPMRRHGFVASPVMASMRVSFCSPTEISSRFPFLSYADTDGSQYLYSSCVATHLEASHSFHAL